MRNGTEDTGPTEFIDTAKSRVDVLRTLDTQANHPLLDTGFHGVILKLAEELAFPGVCVEVCIKRCIGGSFVDGLRARRGGSH